MIAKSNGKLLSFSPFKKQIEKTIQFTCIRWDNIENIFLLIIIYEGYKINTYFLLIQNTWDFWFHRTFGL